MGFTKQHINVDPNRLIESVWNTSYQAFQAWPEHVREIALNLAAELFMLRSNPFVNPEMVRSNVWSQFSKHEDQLPAEYHEYILDRLEAFWSDYEDYCLFQSEVKEALQDCLPKEYIVDSPHALVQCATDATGLIMELPLLVVYPEKTEDVQNIIRLARKKGFYVIPRGGGSGLTGGALSALRKSVIMSMTRMKTIFDIDPQERVLWTQSGVITLDAIKAVQEKGMLFTVDPASKSASSLGGNISENAGGPYAFEYGTTLDNILSFKMVTAKGEIIEVWRKDHPRHKIYPEDYATFDIFDSEGQLQKTVTLKGEEIRTPGLGKDVTNKFLGGLPGVQKEGVDGIITEARFVLYPQLKYSRTLCLEFYGSSMHSAALVIEDLVHLRDQIRQSSNAVTMSALEEFGAKYVQAINYCKKSNKYEGDPISVLLIQLDSNRFRLLDEVAETIVDICEQYQDVDILVARDNEEAELFWEDRHKLSAISRRTSGFKINEDVVIPLGKIPEFSDFIESLNLHYLSLGYQKALNQIKDLEEKTSNDDFVAMEMDMAEQGLSGKFLEQPISEQELALQIHYFFFDLIRRYPDRRKEMEGFENDLFYSRLEIANHMHAGDGNCHVNIPVHSNHPEMIKLAEEAVDKVFNKVLQLGGEVSGEHGIGITKIQYLSEAKIKALKEYKDSVDPENILNPEKLQQKELVVSPYTLSWDRLIQDLSDTDIPNKETLMEQLAHIQICTRCGKCKQVCPMYYPEKGYLHHPRNKNISLWFLLEALLYAKSVTGELDEHLLSQLQELMEYCTACGKCMSVCPVKINSADVTLNLRSYLEQEGASGHPIKSKMLHYFGQEPEKIPWAAKAAALGQTIQSKAVNFIPSFWRRRMRNPLFIEPGPSISTNHIYDILDLKENSLFLPEERLEEQFRHGVLYFPGCGAGLFYPEISLAGIYLLLHTGFPVVVPNEHKCCGYPILSAGCLETFDQLKKNNINYFQDIFQKAADNGILIDFMLTSCGTGRAALENYNLSGSLSNSLQLMDVFQFILPYLKKDEFNLEENELLYHAACHGAWTNVPTDRADLIYAENLGKLLDVEMKITPYCCAESGLGALTAPKVYNQLRKRKKLQMREDLEEYERKQPLLVSCPSCKIGINRIMQKQKYFHPVLHALEYLIEKIKGSNWQNRFLNSLQRSPQENAPLVIYKDL